VERVGSFACEFCIRQATVRDLRHGHIEAVSIIQLVIFGSPVIETKHLLVKVTIKMERLNRHVSPAQVALEEAPEVLQAIRVDLTVDVPLSVIHNVVDITQAEFVIGCSSIGIDLGTIPNLLQDFVLQSLTADVRDDLATNLAKLAVENSLHGSLAHEHIATPLLTANLSDLESTGLVHVGRLATDKSLVCFDGSAFRTAEFECRLVLYRFPDTVKHEPCSFLSDTQGPVNFHAADTVLAVHDHPESSHPLVERDGGIFKDGSDLDGELFLTALAEPNPASANESVLVGAAPWASDLPIDPAEFNRKVEGSVWIGEVDNCLLKCFWLFHVNNCN